MLWLHKNGGMYFFLFGKLSQYLAEEIHTRRRRLPTEENREEFKLGFHVCLISSLESLFAYMRTFFNDQSTKLAFGAIPTQPFSFQGVVNQPIKLSRSKQTKTNVSANESTPCVVFLFVRS